MNSQLKEYAADHRYLMDLVARQADFATPVAVNLDEFYAPLMKSARKGPLLPIDGVLVRDWDPDCRMLNPGVQLGLRVYEIEGIRFLRVRFPYHDRRNWGA